ncbi:21460_t:CDS:2, partial [Gigaspora margarita]
YAYLNTNQAKNCELCFEKLTKEMTAIGFITLLFKKILLVSEVHCDTTYKTAKDCFELYALIVNFEGTGFPLAYLVLDLTNTSKDTPQDEKRTYALSTFFYLVRNQGLFPTYFFTDKDFSEINAAREVWPKADVQLCLWHIERALKQKLISNKKIQRIQYRPNNAAIEFNFIDPNFKPSLENDAKNYEIPINASGQYLTLAKIQEKA